MCVSLKETLTFTPEQMSALNVGSAAFSINT